MRVDFAQTPIWLFAIALFAAMAAATLIGRRLRARRDRRRAEHGEAADSREGYIVSAVFGLLALLTGFTFGLALDRFETRRLLVLDEANAIGTTYLRAQLLDEPHRTRLSGLLATYLDNRITLGEARRRDAPALAALAENDRLLTDLWTATVAAFPSMKDYDFSSSFLETMNRLIDIDAERKAARRTHVPTEVFFILVVYLIVACGVMGYVLVGEHNKSSAGFLVFLFGLSLLLVIDIDRPTLGYIRESQEPMTRARQSMQPPEVFDRFSAPQP